MKHEAMNARRIIRAQRLLAEQGHAGDTLAALNEMAALRKDAERYRWLRKNAITLDDFAYYVDDEVEAFVDAQMAGTPAVGAA